MCRPNDVHGELVAGMSNLLDSPDLDAEELGRVAMTLERLIGSDSITETTAAGLLADRIWRPA
jgi:hypothetical protein